MALITTTVDVGTGVTSTGDTVITPGELVASGGTISNTVATDGGVAIAFNGGVEIGTIVANGAISEVAANGTAIGTVIGAGGLEFLFEADAVTSGALVLTGGIERIFSAGVAVGMAVNGGSAFVSSGGAASGAGVIDGGMLTGLQRRHGQGATVAPAAR